MNRAIGLALLVAGIALVVYGFNASDSVSSDVSRAFTGSPTNKTLLLLLGGAGAIIIGGRMSLGRTGKT
jgi:Protein of unknown function (DUF3185)